MAAIFISASMCQHKREYVSIWGGVGGVEWEGVRMGANIGYISRRSSIW